MSRRKSSIPTLVAARVRPTRQAPLPSRGGNRGAGLRLTYGMEPPHPEAPSDPALEAAAARQEAQRAAGALRTADAAIGSIDARLLRLERLLRPFRTGRRRSPWHINGVQAEIDTTLRAIEDLVDEATFDGLRLLNGEWSIMLTDVLSGRQQTVRIPRIATDRLGDPRVGFLSSTRSGKVNALRRGPLVTVHVIVESAASQVSRHRAELGSFSVNVIEPLLHAWDVALESIDAARNVLQDGDFAVKTSQLTQVDALLSTSAQLVHPHMPSRPPVMKLVEEPEG